MLLQLENNIAPNGAVLDHFVKAKFNYRETCKLAGLHAGLRMYQKTLSNCDNPTHPHLTEYSIMSYLVLDLINGKVIDHFIAVGHYRNFYQYDDFNNYAKSWIFNGDTQVLEETKKLFEWHAHIVVAVRDYCDGGWLKTTKIKKIIKHFDESRELPYADINYKNVNELTKYQISELGPKIAKYKKSPDIWKVPADFITVDIHKDYTYDTKDLYAVSSSYDEQDYLAKWEAALSMKAAIEEFDKNK